MAYFPESIMPERFKCQSDDVDGNPFVVNGKDINKHNDEIIAIETLLGVSKPNFPVGYSGTSYPSGFSGFSGSPYSFSSACDKTNILQTLDNALDKIREIRNNMILTTSGVVCVLDPKVSGEDGNIIFPTNWPTTTLVTALSDDSHAYDSVTQLDVLPYVQLANVSDMPETGYISIINEVSWTWTTVDDMSRLTIEYSRFGTETSDLQIRRRNIAGTVEVMRYSGIDKVNSRILNVKRRQLGSTSTPHYAGDKVFKGRLSLQISPSLYAYANSYAADSGNLLLYKSIHLELLQSGNIKGYLGLQINNSLYDDSHSIYASYQSQLIRSVDPMDIFDPLKGC